VAAKSAKPAKTPRPDALGRVIVAQNRVARHEFEIVDTIEAGMVLTGSEVKSLRDGGKAQIADAFARIEGHEVWLLGADIAPYTGAKVFGHRPGRPRKLLLHRAEILKLNARMQQQGLTLVALALYFRDGRAKLELALARRKRKADKREALARRDADLEARRAMSRHATDPV
jgi:SsrA-binding protein